MFYLKEMQKFSFLTIVPGIIIISWTMSNSNQLNDVQQMLMDVVISFYFAQ
jgi:hypothetical protein